MFILAWKLKAYKVACKYATNMPLEHISSQRLSKRISNHIASRNMPKNYLPLRNTISKEVVSGVHILGPPMILGVLAYTNIDMLSQYIRTTSSTCAVTHKLWRNLLNKITSWIADVWVTYYSSMLDKGMQGCFLLHQVIATSPNNAYPDVDFHSSHLVIH